MAIIDDVNQALVDLIAATVYPNGPAQPSAIASQGYAGNINIFPGWPDVADVDDPDFRPYIEGGERIADISVVDFGTSRNTTRFALQENIIAVPEPTLTWAITGDTATLSGTVSVPQNLCISANGGDYLIAVQEGDTLQTCVARIAAQIPNATVYGTSITALFLDAARVGVVAQTATEVARQISNIRVGIYAGEKSVSGALIRLIRPVLDRASRLTLPDTSVIHILQGAETSDYKSLKTGVRTKALIYPVEFPSLMLGTAAQAIAWKVTIAANNGPPILVQG